jgi:hypothetical protein
MHSSNAQAQGNLSVRSYVFSSTVNIKHQHECLQKSPIAPCPAHSPAHSLTCLLHQCAKSRPATESETFHSTETKVESRVSPCDNRYQNNTIGGGGDNRTKLTKEFLRFHIRPGPPAQTKPEAQAGSG